MNTKHSPGVWVAEEVGDTGGENPALVWEVTNGYRRVAEFLNTEDARLVAAAPELLEALQALVHEYEPNLKAFALNAPRRAIWENAVAAITKATGERQ